MTQSQKWLATAYFFVYNFEEKKLWPPDTYWYAVLDLEDYRKKSIFGLEPFSNLQNVAI